MVCWNLISWAMSLQCWGSVLENFSDPTADKCLPIGRIAANPPKTTRESLRNDIFDVGYGFHRKSIVIISFPSEPSRTPYGISDCKLIHLESEKAHKSFREKFGPASKASFSAGIPGSCDEASKKIWNFAS
ncbi:hypothetical protein TNIN_359171 [Trichonephila inaurata madagascariensis]|uniref:Uncharacterized protein n=1 Tax=Trichonephila inaurata madagascariensis TaxID=2747483 RepID=A0A8X6X9G2_9ARAC|nr:hypothetical protein TNIN_359171 [Trichonephila inaurata madagascariensis]